MLHSDAEVQGSFTDRSTKEPVIMAYTTKAVLFAATVSVAISPLAASVAAAQSARDPYYDQGGAYNDRSAPPPGYDDRGGPPAGYDDRYYDESYDRAPPSGYDGTRPPPPPRGWRDDGNDARYLAEDDRYASYTERWAQDNCVKSRSNAVTGAVVGGVIGALLGNGLSGRRDRTGGTIAGGALGAVGGAAIGGQSGGQTSPGCPPGYVVRGGAANFAYAGGPGFVYAAPAWYRPWVFVGSRWVYRPYPYHRFYARYYGPRRFYYGRPGWRRGPGFRRW
jgi:hypothetical protein